MVSMTDVMWCVVCLVFSTCQWNKKSAPFNSPASMKAAKRHRHHAGSFLDGVAHCSTSWLWLKMRSHHLCRLDRCWTNRASRRGPSQQSRATDSPCRSTGSSQELLWLLCSLHEIGKAWKIYLTGPVGLNKPGEAWGCRDGIVMLVPHCSHDYCNRRQRPLLRTSPRSLPVTWSLLALSGSRWKQAIHQLGQPSTIKWVSCGKINGIGSLHHALKQRICCMLLSVVSEELSERKRLDFKLLAESDQS